MLGLVIGFCRGAPRYGGIPTKSVRLIQGSHVAGARISHPMSARGRHRPWTRFSALE